MLTELLIRGSEIRFPAKKRDFSLLQIVQTEFGAQKTAFLTGIEEISPQVNRSGRENNQLSSPGAEGKNK